MLRVSDRKKDEGEGDELRSWDKIRRGDSDGHVNRGSPDESGNWESKKGDAGVGVKEPAWLPLQQKKRIKTENISCKAGESGETRLDQEHLRITPRISRCNYYSLKSL